MTAIRPVTPLVRPVSVRRATATTAAVPNTPVKAVPQVEPAESRPWDVKRILKTAGVGMAGFVGGGAATLIADLFFHFGNNGGTAWPGGIYLAGAGLIATGAMALYNHVTKD